MIPPIESAILELKSGLKLKFEDDEIVKLTQITFTQSKVQFETQYDSIDELLSARDKFYELANEVIVLVLPFNQLHISYRVESIKSLILNYK